MSKNEEIRLQAVRLMAEKGFEAVSLRQLAAAVGMRPGSIYAHYQSKAHLLREVCRDYLEDLLEVWKERRKRRGQGAARQLQAFVTVHISFSWARPEESRIVRLDVRSLDESGRALIDELKGHYAAELEVILRRGVQEGVFLIEDLHVTRLGVICLLQGFGAVGGDTGCASEVQAITACTKAVLQLVGAPALGQLVNVSSRSGGALSATERLRIC